MLSTTLDPNNRLVVEVFEQRWNEKKYFEPGPFNFIPGLDVSRPDAIMPG